MEGRGRGRERLRVEGMCIESGLPLITEANVGLYSQNIAVETVDMNVLNSIHHSYN